MITLGVGFVSSSELSILPEVHLPVGLDGGSPSFGIVIAINF
jgi:hypothetical protein